MFVPRRYCSHRSKARSTVSDTRSSASSRARASLRAKLYSASRCTSASCSKCARGVTPPSIDFGMVVPSPPLARSFRRRALEAACLAVAQVRRDEPFQVLADPLHDPDVTRHTSHQHAALERGDDEAREPYRVDVVSQRRSRLSQQRIQLIGPASEHIVEPPPEQLMRIRQFPGEVAER